MKKSQHGFSAIEGLLILVIAGLIGFVGWYVWHSTNKKTISGSSDTSQTAKSGNKKTQSQPNSLSTGSPAVPGTGQTTTPNGTTTLLTGNLTVNLPTDWTKLSDTEISRSLNGTKYVVSFSLGGQETLTASSPYAQDGAGAGSIHTTSNAQLWVNRSDADSYYSWVYVSACQPGLCSPKISGKYLFISLSDQTSGSPQKLYFRYSDSDANTVLGDFFKILQSSNL